MRIIPLLHFYQPQYQFDDILERVVKETYSPILSYMLKNNKSRIVVNISGVLTNLLASRGYSDILDMMLKLTKNKQIELVGSAMYHPILPLLPDAEIHRQIMLNEEANRTYFGSLYRPSGFFAPEMAVSPELATLLLAGEYKWLAAPSMAHPHGQAQTDVVYKYENTGGYVFFRNQTISHLLLNASVRTVSAMLAETRDLRTKDKYWFVVMDAETFGHHRVGHEKLLFEMWESPELEIMTVQDFLQDLNLPIVKTGIRASTWTNEEQDFWLDQEKTKPTADRSFILWHDPENPIHKLQWELLNFVISQVTNHPGKDTKNWQLAREALDMAVASDQFWWASAKPWWSLEMIEFGAFSLRNIVLNLTTDESATTKVKQLYDQILAKAFEWQRTGYIRKMHLDKSTTYMGKPFKERAPNEWYNQVILELEKEMTDAAAVQDFERAVKWRDAVEKISLGTDIHDITHVIDEFWLGRNYAWAEPKVKPFLEHTWEEFSPFAKEHFLGARTKEEFEEWQKSKYHK